MKILSLFCDRALLAFLLALTTLAACTDKTKTEPAEAKIWQGSVITIQEHTLADEYTTIGSIVADRNIDISSRISSYIKQLTVQEGESVTEGQLLIVLDDEELDNTINQAKAAVDTAQAVLADVTTDLNRFSNLLEQGSISAIKVRKTQLQKSTALENLHAAKAALAVARSQRQYIQIKSPVSGIVTKRHLQVGSLATPGMPLLTIESRDKLKFETYVAEIQLANIKVGDAVTLNIDNVTDPVIGKISQIIYAGDPITHSYKINIALPHKAEPDTAALYTGMFGRTTFVVGHSENVTIPKSALVEKGGLQGVYVIDQENKAWFRWLRIRREWPEHVEIAAGLTAGEQIIDAALPELREGDKVLAKQSDVRIETIQ